MNVLRNTWYAFGLSEELAASGLLGRTVADEPVVVFRREDGSLAALRDRCAHRFVPLSMGRVVSGTVECPYHGLRYDATGACVHSPVENTAIPRAARVPSYAMMERYGILWLWLGEAAQANPALLTDLGFLEDPRRGNVGGAMHTKANYELVIDNLTDLTHVQFVHGKFLASEAFGQLTHTLREEGDSVVKRLVLPRGKPPAFYAAALPDPGMLIDVTFEARWTPPSLVKLTTTVCPAGEPGRPLLELLSAHLVTPETATTSHYIFMHSRDHHVGDPAYDEQVREFQRIAFGDEDKPMLEAQQRAVGDMDPMKLGPVLLTTDAGAVRARRMLASRIAAEAAA